MTAPIPPGFRLDIDADVQRGDERILFGGSPKRALRLSESGLVALRELLGGPVITPAAGVLARRLTDAGLAHPRPPALSGKPDVTVVIPVRDRPHLLATCLDALGTTYPVVVVDDGSLDGSAVATVAAEHGAKLLVRNQNDGPAAARNDGIDTVRTELVALLDSDCVPSPGWIERLAAHFADPLLAAAAPRIVALPSTTAPGRYGAACGSLDLGVRPGRVAPGIRVPYVPTAALLVRRRALAEVTRGVDVFDRALRYGEDVDLIWRLHEAGSRIRYDPQIQVHHHEPQTWTALLTRRFQYGTSAGPLARRHPDAIAPLVLQPWPAMAALGLLARRPAMTLAAVGGAAFSMRRTLRRADLPASGQYGAVLEAVGQTWLGIARYGTQFAAPGIVAGLLSSKTRLTAAALLLTPPVAAYLTRRPALDAARFALGHVAEDIAYGAGVWVGSIRARTRLPLRPTVSWRSRHTARSNPKKR